MLMILAQLLDSSNGGKLLNGNLLNLDSSLIEGPLLSMVFRNPSHTID